MDFFATLPLDIEVLDKALGGGLERCSIISILYDAFSLGWALGFEMFKNLVNRDSFGVIHNYSLPAIKVLSRASFVGLNLQRLATNNNVKIIDIFGSKYSIPPFADYVIQVENPTEETLTPKIEHVYETEVYPTAGNRRIVKLVYTLDGVVTMFGEHVTIKLLNAEVAYLAKMYNRKNIITIFLLNTDVVSKRFVAWVSSISDTLIAFTSNLSRDGELVEKMTILKALTPEFEPMSYEFKVKSTGEGSSHSLTFTKKSKGH
ncbi:RAD55 family ATPase [Pyrococcus yayanosii]|uniref:Uncharacterized protein n=1 Tax=Pyrococcus yayanosii (strain CH1 / JCM 16557) TaxID=529709 RepID=F8AJ57_PYRYC|nr:hypothetical protein [Pyrococcus yayanosii]AEH24498.1 hypothetical protein PYCH_08130 [Pyrococcus yayanosii CH1]